jgi:hypothetical protein
MTLRDLLGKSLSAQISCAMTGDVVRHLTLSGSLVDLRAADGSRAVIDADATLVYEPWFMDRGSVLVKSSRGVIKLCTELDTVKLDDGSVCALEFSDDTLRAEARPS